MAPAIETVALIGGAIVVAGIAYLVYKNSDKQKPKREFTDSLSTKEDRYKSDKKIIEEAMIENDWETLEAMSKDRRVKEFPDLIKMIEEALKNKR
ncbi:hypothetical protein [Arcobacter porcinus]|uniref:Uncharacterized protein n=1 Tax=Arcobacter porcinus TaxID=1935204 RepID=A0A5C2HFA9_9BACT|nr:hypothetical protein [Arcobacter porcinus]OCL97198.1 hypothetical protein AAX27_00105 [Aliarcobacter thereius]QEP39802.1 hypothetical protein APORC_0163 [Arcobacter porcinus]